MGILVAIVVVALIMIGAPLYVIIGAFVFACYAVWPEYVDPWGADFSNNFDVTGKMVELVDTPELVAIPFFMIAGAIMGRGAIAHRLVEFASALFAWLPGGLAVSTIFACMFFAAISGSSPVTVVTIGAVMIPALKTAGYSDKMSHGLVTAAGGLGIVIPPSIPMVVFAIYASMSGVAVKVEDLFIAGIIPGLFIALVLGVYCVIVGRKVARQTFSFRRVIRAARDGFWALFLPAFILGGIVLALFNAIEAAAMSVVLAIVIEVYIHRSLKFEQLPGIMREMSVLMGAILLIITVALGFTAFVEDKEIPQAIGEWLQAQELTPLTFALFLNLGLLVIGCLLDIISAIVLFVPLIIPIAAQCGLDPLHVGLIFIVNLEIGYLTPPLGLNLFVSATYFEKPFGFIVKAVAPFLLMMLISLVIITYVPTLSLAIDRVQKDESAWVPFPDRDLCETGPAFDEGTMQDSMEDDDIQDILNQFDDEGDEDEDEDEDDDFDEEEGEEGEGSDDVDTAADDDDDDFDAEEEDDDEIDLEALGLEPDEAAPTPDAGASPTPDAGSAGD